eukprot:SAG22_NODE_10936_length_509_cov_0.870732_1_plen_65_part_01
MAAQLQGAWPLRARRRAITMPPLPASAATTSEQLPRVTDELRAKARAMFDRRIRAAKGSDATGRA